MKYNSLSLLCQSGNMIIEKQSQAQDLLRLFEKQLTLSISAIADFQDGNLSLFDPQVGDTACQVRAYVVWFLKNLGVFAESEIRKVKALLIKKRNHIKDILKKYLDGLMLYEKKTTLYNYFLKIDALFYVPPEILFIIHFYFLSKIKTFEKDKGFIIDPNNLSVYLDVSKKLSKKIIHHFQVKIAKYSCEFVINLAAQLEKLGYTESLMREFLVNDNDGRELLPCYLTMKVLLSHMRQKKVPILIKLVCRYNQKDIAKFKLLYIYSEAEEKFIIINEVDIDNDLQSCVSFEAIAVSPFEGFPESNSKFLERFKSFDLEELILSYMAKHPQYVSHISSENNQIDLHEPYVSKLKDKIKNLHGDELNLTISKKKKNLEDDIFTLSQLNDEFQLMRDFADKNGCCQENMSLFFIKHIYCDRIKLAIDVPLILGCNQEVNFHDTIQMVTV